MLGGSNVISQHARCTWRLPLAIAWTLHNTVEFKSMSKSCFMRVLGSLTVTVNALTVLYTYYLFLAMFIQWKVLSYVRLAQSTTSRTWTLSSFKKEIASKVGYLYRRVNSLPPPSSLPLIVLFSSFLFSAFQIFSWSMILESCQWTILFCFFFLSINQKCLKKILLLDQAIYFGN